MVLYYGLYGTLSSQRVPRSLQVGCSDLYGRSQNLPDPLAARLTPFFSHTRTTQVASWHLVLSESQTTGEVSRLGYSAHVPPRMDASILQTTIQIIQKLKSMRYSLIQHCCRNPLNIYVDEPHQKTQASGR